jgi:hypothetical protein
MCRRTCAAAQLTVSFRTPDGAGRQGACRWLALGLALACAGLPARAQPPGPSAVLPPPDAVAAPAPTPPGPAVIGQPPAPAPGCCGGTSEAGFVAADIHWGWYAETGPVFPVGGTLQHHLDPGWTVQGGLREWRNSDNGSIFAELSAEYWSFNTKTVTQNTGVDVFLPDGATRKINFFNETTLTDLQQFGFHGAIGGTYYPEALNGFGGVLGADRGVFLTGRVGFRGGVINAYFTEVATPGGIALLHSFEDQHGDPTHDPNKVRLVDHVKSFNNFFGPFGTLGAGLNWNDVSVGNAHLGNIALTAEVEVGYEATDLGEYLHEAVLITVSPRITLVFSY